MQNDHKSGVTRRGFLSVALGALGAGAVLPGAARAAERGALATLIDVSLCDGCPGREMPACVAACKAEHNHTIPQPVDPIPVPFPRAVIEDWSKRQGVSDRLTPYNRIFIQRAEVEYQGVRRAVSIPRRCMHCDNPACATLCPFSANHKHKNGAVVIDPALCFGGAKCRTLCPWEIPQRQSGVGLYLHVLPTLMGNGTMYKCDLCHERLQEGREPACIEACPKKALLIGDRDWIFQEAEDRARRMQGFIYGKRENGGTSTLYVSPVPFDVLDQAVETGKGRPGLKPVKRRMDATDPLGAAVLAAPAVGLAAGLAGSIKLFTGRRAKVKKEEANND